MVHVRAPAAGGFDRYWIRAVGVVTAATVAVAIVGVGARVYVVDYRVTGLKKVEANDALPVEVAFLDVSFPAFTSIGFSTWMNCG